MTAIIIVSVLLITTTVINIILSYVEGMKFPAPGKIAEFDDTELHVYSRGKKDQSKPHVIILHDVADFAPAITHYELIKELSQNYRTVIVERSGSGWSGDTFAEKSAENVVFEYRKALAETREGNKRYILLAFGNSINYAESWKMTFPDEICGIVWVDKDAKKYNNITDIKIKPILLAIARELGFLRIYSLIFGKKFENQSTDNNGIILGELFCERIMSAPVRNEIEYIAQNSVTDNKEICFDISVNNNAEILGAIENLSEEERFENI